MKQEHERAWDAEGRWCGAGKAVRKPVVKYMPTHEGCTPAECGGEFQCSKCDKLVGYCFGHDNCTRCNACCHNRQCPGNRHTAHFKPVGGRFVGWRVTCSCGDFEALVDTRELARERHRHHKDYVGA